MLMVLSTDTQSSPPPDDFYLLELTKEEMNKKTHDVVAAMFMFTTNLAHEIGGGENVKYIEYYIIRETMDRILKKLED